MRPLGSAVRFVRFAFLLWIVSHALASAKDVTALVGGTLIDGFGGEPIRNSVVFIEGERITAVGTVGTLEIPQDAEILAGNTLARSLGVHERDDFGAAAHPRAPRNSVAYSF